MYYQDVRGPSRTELELIEHGASLAAVAVFSFYLWGRYRWQGSAQGGTRIRDTAVYSHWIVYGSLVLLLVAVVAIAVLRVPV